MSAYGSGIGIWWRRTFESGTNYAEPRSKKLQEPSCLCEAPVLVRGRTREIYTKKEAVS